MTKKELNALTKIAKKTIVPMKSRTDGQDVTSGR